ncbi:MAG: Uma2 family endonuclease [Thermoflexibacter sp.]|jgi:Uma2 family endonuclease|nr:Uma2 family endonuclease [Thermoflexibacter sp.]
MESITIKFPTSYTQEQFEALQALNQEVKVKANTKGNQVTFYESAFSFGKVSFFHVQLPESFIITEEQFEAICNENKSAKLEFDDYNQLTINMLTTAIIASFTLAIGSILYFWSIKNKNGKAYDATARYNLYDKNNKLKRRAADSSYISFQTASKSVQSQWKFIELPPDLVIEIVSSPYDEAREIKKMREDWLVGGAKVGIVVNPHNAVYYVFEKGDIGYTICKFDTPFTHYLFAGLSLDFATLLDEALDNE